VLDTTGSATVRLDPTLAYKFVLKDASGTTQWTEDYYGESLFLTASTIGAALYPQTAAELAAGVTPTAYQYPACHPMRYGAVGNGVADDHVAVQAAFTVAGKAGSFVNLTGGYTYLCSADVSVPVAQSFGGPLASARGDGWATPQIIFGTGSTYGFTILGTGATTGGTTSSNYNYAGSFENMCVKMTGTSNTAFYVNSVNQPKLKNVWITGSSGQGRAIYLLNDLVPVLEDVLITGMGSATQGSCEIDLCTTSSLRSFRISGGVTTVGALLIDRCTNTTLAGLSLESAGVPLLISSKSESSVANTSITCRGLELENPGNGNAYIDIGSGLSGSALVVNFRLDGWYATPSGTITVPYGIRMQNTLNTDLSNGQFTQASATSAIELVGTNNNGCRISPHRNLQAITYPWVRYNGTQVLHAGPQHEWYLGLLQNGHPICCVRGFRAIYDAGSVSQISGATPSCLISATVGGYYDTLTVANGGATTVTSLSGGEPGMEITMIATNANTTLTFGNSGGAFRFNGNGGTNIGSNSTMVAGRAYRFINDGANGAGGSCWVQV